MAPASTYQITDIIDHVEVEITNLLVDEFEPNIF